MYLIIIILISLIIGSFLNVVVYRLPKMLQQTSDVTFNIALPASHCPHCKTPIKFWHNIPIFSFCWLKGRCHACKEAISKRYPLVEALTVVLSVIVLFQVGWQILLWPVLLFTYALIALTFIDIDEHILPDCITLPLLWIGLALNTLELFTTVEFAIWGAILGYTLLWLIDRLYHMLRKRPGIGPGDFKLLAALGAWLGAPALIPIVLIASVLGLLVALTLLVLKRLSYETPIAFGPFLAIAGWGYFILRVV